MTANVTPTGSDLTGLSVAMVGPGHVGRSLGMWLHRAGAAVEWLVGRTAVGARDAARELGATVIEIEQVMNQAWDLLLLAPPDGVLAKVVDSLAETPTREDRHRVALHTSGSQSAAVLARLGRRGVELGSFHPLLGFPRVRPEPVPGVVYGVDGDPRAVELCRRLAAAFGGETVHVAAEVRLLYHYCATLAAGGVSTVLAVVDELSECAGLEPAIRRGLSRLSLAAAEEAAEHPDASLAITGPIARGDLDLAEEQLLAATGKAPDLRAFLTELHRQTERQVRRGRERAQGAAKNTSSGE